MSPSELLRMGRPKKAARLYNIPALIIAGEDDAFINPGVFRGTQGEVPDLHLHIPAAPTGCSKTGA